MKIILKTIFYASITIVGIMAVFSLLAIIQGSGQRFINRETFRYKGESLITANQFATLAQDHTFGNSYSDITSINATENGVLIEYDFYDEDLEYLEKLPYKVTDIPGIQKWIATYEDVKKIGPYIVGTLLLGIILSVIDKFLKSKSVDTRKGLIYYLRRIGLLIQTRGNLKHTFDRYDVALANDIYIDPDTVKGILAFRTWRISKKDNVLYSVVMKTPWIDKTIYTDKIPDDDNFNGCHGFRIGSMENEYYQSEMDDIIGIVELGGNFAEHEDGIIRSQSCTIIALIINEKYSTAAVNYSKYYGVPVILANNVMLKFKNWVVSRNGIDCMIHNIDLIEGVTDGI